MWKVKADLQEKEFAALQIRFHELSDAVRLMMDDKQKMNYYVICEYQAIAKIVKTLPVQYDNVTGVKIHQVYGDKK